MHEALRTSTSFEWTRARARAALLLASGGLSAGTIAEHVGVSRRAVSAWRRHPEFAARVRGLVLEAPDTPPDDSPAKLDRLLAGLDRRWRQLGHAVDRIVSERAADPTMRGVPGGTTGLVVRKVKVVGRGESRGTVEEYPVDRRLLAVMREMGQLERLAARLVGDPGG
jgi:hypothetical protein